MGPGDHPKGAGALNHSRGGELRMIEGVESLEAEIQMLPLEGQGEDPLDGQGEWIVLDPCHRVPRRAAIVVNGLREMGGIEELGVRSVGEVERLTRNQIGALVLVAV